MDYQSSSAVVQQVLERRCRFHEVDGQENRLIEMGFQSWRPSQQPDLYLGCHLDVRPVLVEAIHV